MICLALDITLILVLECGLLLSGCAGLRTQAEPNRASPVDFEGVWDGTTVNDCSPVQSIRRAAKQWNESVSPCCIIISDHGVSIDAPRALLPAIIGSIVGRS